MGMLLFLIALTVGEAAYFEYSMEQQTSSGFQEQLAGITQQTDALMPVNKELKETKTSQLAQIKQFEAQIEAVAEKAAAAASPASASTPPTSPSAGLPGADGKPLPTGPSLGTITTASGQTFQNCQLLKTEADGITFSHSQGITKVLFPDLPPNLQKQYGYSATPGTASSEQDTPAMEAAKLRYQEQLRAAGVSNDGTQPAAQ